MHQRATSLWRLKRKTFKYDTSTSNLTSYCRLPIKEIENRGGKELLQHYKTPFTLLSTLYPGYDWLPWKFEKCPTHFWNDLKNQRKFLDWVGKELKIKEMSDWYKINRKSFEEIGGGSLLNMYNTSPSLLLATVYPEYEWLPWRFEVTPKHYWESMQNQRKFMEWMGKELGIKEMSDWYKVSKKDFQDLGGSGLLGKYNNSPSLLVTSVFPEYEWLPWRFPLFHRWNEQTQKQFVEWAGKELKIKDMSDWYRDIAALGGNGLLELYNNSLYKLLHKVYAEFKWEVHKFHELNWTALLQDNSSKKEFVKKIESQLNIKNESDWNKVSKSDIQGIKLPPYWKLSDLLSLVREVYGSSSIFKSKSLSNKKSQSLLNSMLNAMFPNEDVLVEYRHPDIKTPNGQNLELDYFYPKLKLAIEYQGQQHYKTMNFLHNVSSLEERKEIDLQKSVLCKKNGITLVEVPYWWDRKYESLAATIYSQMPEIFISQPTGIPIPKTEPVTPKYSSLANDSIKKTFMLSKNWEESMDPSGWYMTEKYDGMRLYWNGSEFYTRQGNKVKIPDFWKRQLPKIALDGELWTQYGLYQEAVTLCAAKGDKNKWINAVFWVFDAPAMKTPIEERIEFLKEKKSDETLPSFVKVVDFVKCQGKSHLKQYFDSIVAKGGEGVMLREPGSLYKAGRSDSLRKYKPFFDTEVKVVENNYPHGLKCVQANGKELFVGLNDNYQEAKTLRKGSVITVKHLGTNVYGTLQYPKFYRERKDVKWEEIINGS